MAFLLSYAVMILAPSYVIADLMMELAERYPLYLTHLDPPNFKTNAAVSLFSVRIIDKRSL